MTGRPAPGRAPCPICGKPSTPEHRPFCSRRCADVDLHRWLAGAYALPGAPVDEPGEEGGEGARDGLEDDAGEG